MTATALAALLIILAGVAAKRARITRPEDGALLVRIVIYLALPCLVFTIIVRSDLRPALLLVPLAGYLVHFVLVGVSFGGARLLRLDRPATGALVVASAVGNTGFFGVPLISASGPHLSRTAAVMYDSFSTTVITWTSTVGIASAFGAGAVAAGFAWRALGRSLLLPPNLALAAGLVLNLAGVHHLPRYVGRPLDLLAAAVLPMVLIYAGLMLELRGLGRIWRPVGFAIVVRLVVGAAVGLGIAVALGLAGDVLRTTVLMAAMPTAMMSLVIGGQFRLRTEIVAGAIVLTTVLCTLTLPLIRALV